MEQGECLRRYSMIRIKINLSIKAWPCWSSPLTVSVLSYDCVLKYYVMVAGTLSLGLLATRSLSSSSLRVSSQDQYKLFQFVQEHQFLLILQLEHMQTSLPSPPLPPQHIPARIRFNITI